MNSHDSPQPKEEQNFSFPETPAAKLEEGMEPQEKAAETKPIKRKKTPDKATKTETSKTLEAEEKKFEQLEQEAKNWFAKVLQCISNIEKQLSTNQDLIKKGKKTIDDLIAEKLATPGTSISNDEGNAYLLRPDKETIEEYEKRIEHKYKHKPYKIPLPWGDFLFGKNKFAHLVWEDPKFNEAIVLIKTAEIANNNIRTTLINGDEELSALNQECQGIMDRAVSMETTLAGSSNELRDLIMTMRQTQISNFEHAGTRPINIAVWTAVWNPGSKYSRNNKPL